jgi:hypothetical protein
MPERTDSRIEEPLVPMESLALLLDEADLNSLCAAWGDAPTEFARPEISTLVAYCAGTLDAEGSAAVRTSLTRDLESLGLLLQVDGELQQLRKMPLSAIQGVAMGRGEHQDVAGAVAQAWRQILADRQSWTAGSWAGALRNAFLAQWRAVTSAPQLAFSRGDSSRGQGKDAIPSDFDDGIEAMLREAAVHADGSMSAAAELKGDPDELARHDGQEAVLYLVLGKSRTRLAESRITDSKVEWRAQLGDEMGGQELKLSAADLAVEINGDRATVDETLGSIFVAVRDRRTDRAVGVVEMSVGLGQIGKVRLTLPSDAIALYRGGLLRVDLSTGAGWQRLCDWTVESGEFVLDVEIDAGCPLAGLLRAELLIDQ